MHLELPGREISIPTYKLYVESSRQRPTSRSSQVGVPRRDVFGRELGRKCNKCRVWRIQRLVWSSIATVKLGRSRLGEKRVKRDASDLTSFIVPDEIRAWEVAKPVGVSAEKCEAANVQNPGYTTCVVREGLRGVELWKIANGSYHNCSTAANVQETYRDPCYL